MARVGPIVARIGLVIFFPILAYSQSAPVAIGGSFVTDEDTPIQETLPASDADFNIVSFRIVSGPAHGTISAITSAGDFIYTPNRDYNGPDSFIYIVSDSTSLESAQATISLTIKPINDAPIATDGNFAMAEDALLNGTLTATDVDSDSLTFRITTGPLHGTITPITSSGTFTYKPNENFNGTDKFGFKAKDAALDSAEATIFVTVAPINDAPVAQPIAFSVPPDRTAIGQLQGFDADNDVLTYAKRSSPSNGSVTLDPDGRFTYVPNAGFKGSDFFAYNVNDGKVNSAEALVSIRVANDAIGFIADKSNPQLASVDFPNGASSLSASPSKSEDASFLSEALDLAIDRANLRLYVLTANALQIFTLDPATSPATLEHKKSVAVTGKLLALSLDGRTAFVGGTGKVTAINLYPESVFKGGVSIQKAEYENVRVFPFDAAPGEAGMDGREVAAMGVHPAGNRLVVVLEARVKKLNITNDLLRSDVGNGVRSENLDASGVIPDDFGFITQLDISADVQTGGKQRPDLKFSPLVDLNRLIYFGAKVVALGIRSLTFSPDGNCAFISAVGAQTPRATPFGIMPTTDEGTGGIVVLDVRPRANNELNMDYLSFIPTTERGEKTDELRLQIRKEGWKIVHPAVQYARDTFLLSKAIIGFTDGVIPKASPAVVLKLVTGPTEVVNEIVGSEIVNRLEDSYKDYGYMQAYFNLYPRDMVGASSLAINHAGDFGIVTMQDTNNLGLLALSPSSSDLLGYSRSNLPDFYIKTGTGKTINGFNAALIGNSSVPVGSAYSWAYPQKVAFTSDDSRVFIGMAGGTPKADLTNRFGSADALTLRTERDKPDSLSVFKKGNPPPGYSMFGGAGGGLPFMSPRLAATLQSFDADHDLISDQLEAYNRWNVMKMPDIGQFSSLISTDVAHLTDPGKQAPADSGIPDGLDFGYLLPASGVGYRLNTFGLPMDQTNFATKGVVATLEQMGLEWNKRYQQKLPSQLPITRPYFIVGLLTKPGGGLILDPKGEAVKYTLGTGSEVDFPYFTVNSDVAHDFILSNDASDPRNNSAKNPTGFDLPNTEALIRLLLAQPRVTKIELDPILLELIPGIKDDSRLVPHGSLTVKDSRRDMDNHMFVTFGSMKVDLQIDADNNGVIDGSQVEEALKNKEGFGGKFVPPNRDSTMPGIPDYADGFDLTSGRYIDGGSAKFTPMIIRFPEGLDLTKMQFRLIYSASDPSKMIPSASVSGSYELPVEGAYRIWTKDGDKARLKAQISTGDFIASNIKYLVSDLLLRADSAGSNRAYWIYIESVNPSLAASQRDVVVEVFPNAGPQSSAVALTDTVRVSSVFGTSAVDANRDGVIKFTNEENPDITSAEKPYRFWLNDDDDNSNVTPTLPWDELDPEYYPPRLADSANRVISSARDCEDLSRLWLNLAGLIEGLKDPSGNLYLGLKWKVDNNQAPRIRLFRSADPLGGLGYIKSVPAAANQVSGNTVNSPSYCLLDEDEPDSTSIVSSGYDTVTPLNSRKADFIFKKRDLANLSESSPVLHLLFEGVAEGKGQLVPVYLRKNSSGAWESLGEGMGMWIELKNIRRMYMRAHSTPYSSPATPYAFALPFTSYVAIAGVPPYPYETSAPAGSYSSGPLTIPADNLSYAEGDDITDPAGPVLPFEAPPDEEAKCVVFVHGIDMTVEAQLGYAQSFYKRLWWEGYRGRFVTFRWNTTLDDGVGFLTPGRENTSIFNSGEYRSWKAGLALKKYVDDVVRPQMGNQAVISLAAHSLGNACAGEALKLGMQVRRYVAMEAAIPLSCYFPEPADPANDILSGSFRPELLQAELASPTPQYASKQGYAGYLSDIQTNSGAQCIAYQNIDDFWLRTGKTQKFLIPVPPPPDQLPPPEPVNIEVQLSVDWFNYQHDRKPDDRFGFGQYLYDSNIGAHFERGVFPFKYSRLVKDPHEVMAYVSRSRTFPLGAEPANGNEKPPGFFSTVNMKDLYQFSTQRRDHSGQFQRNIQLMYGNDIGIEWSKSFYYRLIRDLDVAPQTP